MRAFRFENVDGDTYSERGSSMRDALARLGLRGSRYIIASAKELGFPWTLEKRCEVIWNDPDKTCSRRYRIKSVKFHGVLGDADCVIIIEDDDGSVLECAASELSPCSHSAGFGRSEKMEGIVNAIIKAGGVVFGGYVRDMLRGVKPHDIDCKGIDGETMYDIFSTFCDDGVRIAAPYSCQRIWSRENDIQVDMISDIMIPDFDVNSLALTFSGIRIVNHVASANHKIEDVICNIHDGVAVPFNCCQAHRIRKMRLAGWIILEKDSNLL